MRPAGDLVSGFYRFAARSSHPIARGARKLYRTLDGMSLPAPRLYVKPLLGIYLALRALNMAYGFAYRLLVCEPLLKARCARYGRRVRTGRFVHQIIGDGDVILGDDILLDGRSAIIFASRFADRPTFVVGDGSGIGHGSSFTVAKRITIGRNCRIAKEVCMLDSSGHSSDPARRLAHLPPTAAEVRPITIGDNVWIGRGAVVLPGVTIGEGSVVSARAVVMGDVPPYTVVTGNPARSVLALTRPGGGLPPSLLEPAPVAAASGETE
jgi:acetyltransferase-like isoleucine patch superfamily enzyme